MNSKQVNVTVTRLISFMGDVKDGELRSDGQGMNGEILEVSFLGGLLHGYRREKIAA